MLKRNIFKSIVLASLVMSIVPSAAVSANNNYPSGKTVVISSNPEQGISPYFNNFANITAGISIDSDNHAVCSGSCIVYSDISTSITVTLMYSTDKTNWKPATGESWTSYYSTMGNHTAGGTSALKLSSRYYYCSLTTITAYDSNGNVTETVNCYSDPCHI